MAAFPPPLVPGVSAAELRHEGFWRRRSRLARAAMMGGGALVLLTALGAVLPRPDVDGSAVAAPDRTDAPFVMDAVPTFEAPAPEEAPVDTAAPTSSAPATSAPTTSARTTSARTTSAPAAAVPPTLPLDTTPPPAVVSVARIVDGDTVVMSDETVVRLIGIDTPEQGQCGYAEAADALAGIVAGHTITLTAGAQDDVDRYGRLLRYLDLETGADANLAMIEAGQAIARYDSRDGYGRHTREDSYVAADVGSAAFCAPVTAVTALSVPPQPAVAIPPPPAPVQPLPNIDYQNCDAVRAAGAAPIHRDDPGFQQKFDRDNDGVGCE